MNFENDPIAKLTSAKMCELIAKIEKTSNVQLQGAAYNRVFEMIYSYEQKLSKYAFVAEASEIGAPTIVSPLILPDFEPMLIKNTLQESSDLIDIMEKNSAIIYGRQGKVRSKRTNYTPKKKKRK